MVLVPMAMLSNILGMMTVWNQISKQDRFWRKKYIGVCRWVSSKIKADDGQVSRDSHEVSKQQEQENCHLKLSGVCQALEKELSPYSVIGHCGSEVLSRNMQAWADRSIRNWDKEEEFSPKAHYSFSCLLPPHGLKEAEQKLPEALP